MRKYLLALLGFLLPMGALAQPIPPPGIPRSWIGAPNGVPGLDAVAAISSTLSQALGSTTPRSFAVRQGERLNIADYKMPSDTDDTASITRAIARAVALGTPQNLYLPCGTYNISGPITLTTTAGTNQGIVVQGQSAACVIVRQNADADGFDITLNNYNNGIFQGSAATISGITLVMQDNASTTRTAISLASASGNGVIGTPIKLDDIHLVSRSATGHWGTGISASNFGTVYISTISSDYPGQSNAGTHISIQGGAGVFETNVFISDTLLVGGELGVNLGNYLQGMHLRNINTVGMDYALKINPLLGLNVEFQVISSYLNGKVLIGPQSQALTGTITGTALVLDAAPATPLTVGTSLVFSNAGTLSNTTITAITDPTHFTVGGGPWTIADEALTAYIANVSSVSMADTYFDSLNSVLSNNQTLVTVNQVGQLKLDGDTFNGVATVTGATGLGLSGTNMAGSRVLGAVVTGFSGAGSVGIKQGAIGPSMLLQGTKFTNNAIDCQDINTAADDFWADTSLSVGTVASVLRCGATGPGNGVQILGGVPGSNTMVMTNVGTDPNVAASWNAQGFPGTDFSWRDGKLQSILGLNDCQSLTLVCSGLSIKATPVGLSPSIFTSNAANNILLGVAGPLAASVTGGLPQIPYTTAAPTGTPASTGGASIFWNDTSKVLNIYSPSANAWYHSAPFTTGGG